jgi:uncharacterized protein
MTPLIARHAAPHLLKLARQYPALVITGPRQSGKTTLSQTTFPDKTYVSLEDMDTREFALHDPRGFLAQYPKGAILDEVQRCPQLFSYLQTKLDADKKSGQFVLTGSQQFDLLSGITQSLAGRVARLTLLPLALAELQTAQRAPKKLEDVLFTGFYPPLHDRKLDPTVWCANYVGTYLERDVRQLISVRDLSSFQRFLKMCAARTGQLLNLSALANDCGISHNTAKAWLSVLEASYIVYLLQPHHRNFNKRLVKTPKLYFLDTGLAAFLLGIERAEQLITHAARGPLFESFVLAELLKARFNQLLPANLYFWRDNVGNEIDVLVESPQGLAAIELKSGQTINNDFFKGLGKFSSVADKALTSAWLIYGGNQSQSRDLAEVVAWNDLSSLVRALLTK